MNEKVNTKSLKKQLIGRFSVSFLIMGLLFYLTAGTMRYWNGWVYMVEIAVPMIFFVIYMFKHDPNFLKRRMKTKEKRQKQKVIVKLAILPLLGIYILPGFDWRFGWSSVSVPVTITGMVLVLIGYLLILYVFRTNSFASRVVEIEYEHTVITTGPYALVRHPMYSSMIVLYLFTPLALGSYWAVIPSLSILPILILRIKDEEIELLRNLRGYNEYLQKVRYRLIPGVW